jgi:hypothetical protein
MASDVIEVVDYGSAKIGSSVSESQRSWDWRHESHANVCAIINDWLNAHGGQLSATEPPGIYGITIIPDCGDTISSAGAGRLWAIDRGSPEHPYKPGQVPDPSIAWQYSTWYRWNFRGGQWNAVSLPACGAGGSVILQLSGGGGLWTCPDPNGSNCLLQVYVNIPQFCNNCPNDWTQVGVVVCLNITNWRLNTWYHVVGSNGQSFYIGMY